MKQYISNVCMIQCADSWNIQHGNSTNKPCHDYMDYTGYVCGWTLLTMNAICISDMDVEYVH
jgi:hypothetical protein